MSFPATSNPENSGRPTPPGLIPRLAGHVAARKLHSVNSDTAGVAASAEGLELNRWQRRVASGRIARGGEQNVLIVGAGRLGREMAAILERERIHGRTVVGFVDEREPVGGNVLGRVADLARIARREFVDEVILAIPDQPDLARRVIRESRRNRLNIRVIPDLFDDDGRHNRGFEGGGEGGQAGDRLSSPLVLEYFGGLPVLALHQEKAPRSGLFWKRVLDIVLSALALVATAPLMAMIALAIKMASPGPVLYRAKRAGLKGRKFIARRRCKVSSGPPSATGRNSGDHWAVAGHGPARSLVSTQYGARPGIHRALESANGPENLVEDAICDAARKRRLG